MSALHDLIDWVGGLPFEVARPDAIFNFYLASGFRLVHLKTCGGRLGCNEFTFARSEPGSTDSLDQLTREREVASGRTGRQLACSPWTMTPDNLRLGIREQEAGHQTPAAC